MFTKVIRSLLYGTAIGLLVWLSRYFMDVTPIQAVILGLVFGLIIAIFKFIVMIVSEKFKEYKNK